MSRNCRLGIKTGFVSINKFAIGIASDVENKKRMIDYTQPYVTGFFQLQTLTKPSKNLHPL